MLLSVQNFLKLNPLIRQRQPKMLETALRSLQLFQVFGEYPEDIQRQLASVAYLEEFEPGKMIIKEGQVPERYYMVLSGQALRSRAIRLPAGNMQLKIHGIISTGMDFGNEEQILTNITQIPPKNIVSYLKILSLLISIQFESADVAALWLMLRHHIEH